jgi:hypothetical protein
MDALVCKMVYRSKAERLWIWNSHAKKWGHPIRAVSGGGRGQYSGVYGKYGERQYTGRISNVGGPSGANPTSYGTIPNGIYKVEEPDVDTVLGPCAELTTVKAFMMGRSGFYIHGRGPKGSDGCIVPVDPKINEVLHLVKVLQLEGSLYLRVEESVVMDLPEQLPSNVA